MRLSLVIESPEVRVMESLLFLLIPLACPLAMGALGIGAWMWAKMRSAPAKLAGGHRVKAEA
jgi:hypothetical protein